MKFTRKRRAFSGKRQRTGWAEGLFLLQEIHDHYEEEMARWKPHPDGPGHCHSKPGHWDADGRPCEWCATWNRLRSFIQQNDNHEAEEPKEK